MEENQIELTLDEEIEMSKARTAELMERKNKELAEQRAVALLPVRAAIKAHGFTARELGLEYNDSATKGAPATEKSKRQPVLAKYRDPITGNEWTGRGKMPGWLAGFVGAGRDKDDFLISKYAPVAESGEPAGAGELPSGAMPDTADGA